MGIGKKYKIIIIINGLSKGTALNLSLDKQQMKKGRKKSMCTQNKNWYTHLFLTILKSNGGSNPTRGSRMFGEFLNELSFFVYLGFVFQL